MILHPNEVAWCVLHVGFSTTLQVDADTHAVVMTAICLTETAARSRGGPDAAVLARSADPASPNLGNWDAGVAQLSNKYHGARLREAALRGEDWRHPLVNLRIAKKIWDDAGGPTPWAVFKSGSFRELLPDARIAMLFPFPPTHVLN